MQISIATYFAMNKTYYGKSLYQKCAKMFILNKFSLFAITFALLLFILHVSISRDESSGAIQLFIQEPIQNYKTNSTKYILLYNKMFNDYNWRVDFTESSSSDVCI